MEALKSVHKGLADYKVEVNNFRDYNKARRYEQADQKENAGIVMAKAREVRDGVYAFVGGVKSDVDKTANTVLIMMIFAVIAAAVVALLIGLWLTNHITEEPVYHVAKILTNICQWRRRRETDPSDDPPRNYSARMKSAPWRGRRIVWSKISVRLATWPQPFPRVIGPSRFTLKVIKM